MEHKHIRGGIHGDATVTVLAGENRQERTVKLSELRPGEYIQSSLESSYWRVDEVLSFRRRLKTYEIRLETGEALTLAEGTNICGQYGPTLFTDKISEPYVYVEMTYFDHDHRRRFGVQLRNPDKAPAPLKRMFSPTARKLEKFRKSYYFFNDLLKFLDAVRESHRDVAIVGGCDVMHSYEEGTYSLSAHWRGKTAEFPIIPLTTLTVGDKHRDIAFLAIHQGGWCHSMHYRKVVSVKTSTSDGPWYFPIFDSHDMAVNRDILYGAYVRQRFVFPVNGVPVFYPNPYLASDIGELTLEEDGQSVYPQEPAKPLFVDLDGFYRILRGRAKADRGGHIPITDETIPNVLLSLRACAAAGMDADSLCDGLLKLCQAESAPTKESSVPGASVTNSAGQKSRR